MFVCHCGNGGPLGWRETFNIQMYQSEDRPHHFKWMDIIAAGVIMMVWDHMIGLLSHS